MERKEILKGTAILTLAGVITRILGFFYRIYMSKTIGAEGMGLLHLITPLYTLVWSISSAGLSTTVSKLTSQEYAKKSYGNISLVLKLSIATALFLSLILSILVYLFSDFIAIDFLKDNRCAPSLRLISICFPFMAIGSVLRGYFFGMQNQRIPASSQVLEQVIRMVCVYLLSDAMLSKGLEAACCCAVIGMALGEIISFFYVLICYHSFKSKLYSSSKPLITSKACYIMVLSCALPLTLNKVTGSMLATLENTLIPQRLQLFGLTKSEATALFGNLCAMAMPLVTFPSSLLFALSGVIMPVVSRANALGNIRAISKASERALHYSLILGLGVAGLFMLFPREIGFFIYSTEEVGEQLFLLSFICPFLYLQVTISGILNGLGKQLFIFINSLISSLISIGFVLFCIPRLGIIGFIIGSFVSMVISSSLSLYMLSSLIGFRLKPLKHIIKPTLSITLSVILTDFAYRHLSYYLPFKPLLILCAFMLALIYLALLYITQTFKN